MSGESSSAKKSAFGVENLLDGGARVLYENLFSTKHVGRVLDFVLFESADFFARSPAPDECEHRARQAIELAVFNAWTSYRESERVKCVEFEFGWDKNRFVFSCVHYAPQALAGFLPIAKEGEEPNSESAKRIALMLSQIQDVSDGLIVRYDPKSGRMQIIAYITPVHDKREARGLEYVDVNHVAEASKAESSVEPEPISAGKLDAFLDDEKEDAKKRGAPKAEDGANDEKIVVPGGDAPLEDKEVWLESAAKKATGGKLKDEGDDKLVVKSLGNGGAQEKEEAVFKIKSGEVIEAGELVKVKRLSGAGQQGAPATGADGGADTSGSDLLNTMSDLAARAQSDGDITDKIESSSESTALDSQEAEESVQVLLQTMKGEVMPLCPELSKEQFDEAFRAMGEKLRENYMQTMHHLLRVKNIQTISKVKHYKDQISVLTAKIDQLNAEKQDLIDTVAEKDSVEGEILKLKNSSNPEEAAKATKLEEEKFNKALDGYKQSLDNGTVPQGAQDWAKGFMETMLKERAVLGQRAREIDSHLRKREYDLKSKETAFKEQIRIKDELIRQKDFSMQKTKESLANALAALDKKRSELAESGGDKNEGQGKVSTLERLLKVSKDTNEKMQKRSEELQVKWQSEFNARSQVQHECSRLRKQVEDQKKKLSDAGLDKLQGNFNKVTQEKDRAMKLVDELKRQTKELQGKLMVQTTVAKAGTAAVDAAKKVAVTGDAELKHKLDHSNKMVKAMKDELDRSRKKVDEIKQEETKLRIEVARLQEELKKAGRAGGAAPAKGKPSTKR